MSGRPITSDHLYLFRWIDHIRISSAGDRVAYQLSWADRDTVENRSRIYVQGLEPGGKPGGQTREIASTSKRDGHPEWSPDGRSLAFLGKRGARDQLHLEVDGGEPRQLTTLPDGVLALKWSPDGTRIAFVAQVLGDPSGVVDDPRPAESDDQARRPPVARVANRLDYKHDGQGYVDGRYPHLFVVTVAGGEPHQLTDGAWSVEGFDWAPDSSRLAVTGNAEPDSDLSRDKNLYVVGLDRSRRLVAGGLELGTPTWSPRGGLIAFLAPRGQGSGFHDRIWLVSAEGGNPSCLTGDLDRSVGGSVINDMRGGHSTRLVWSAAGDRIHFQASSPGTAGLWSVDLDGQTSKQVEGRRSVYDFDVAGETIVFCAGDAGQPGEAFSFSGEERRLTDLNPWLAERYVAQPEQLEFTAKDGLQLEGWLLKPDGFDPSRKHPLVMEIHGGPHAQYGWTFFHEFQVLAGQGYLVFYVNPRGSDGYGEDFKRACVRDWGGKDYEDLMTALDHLIERSQFIDTARLGVGGGSYGGFMTNWVVGHTDRFAAAVSMRSISNLVSEYAQHDIVLWSEIEMGPPPWPDLDELWRRSPIRYVRDVKTPLLLTHGEMDLRCAISQAEELFGALRLLGKTVEMVRFPGESHDLSRGGRPDRRVERLNRITGWFGRFLLSKEPSELESHTVTA